MAAKKILLVDDDDALVEAYRTVLESAGYAVETAPDSKAGLAAAQKSPPDLIVLDVMMESATAGIDLARKLRSDAKLARTRLLMITSVSQKTGVDVGSSAGEEFLPVDTFLEKPVDPRRLIEEAKALLG